MTAAAEKVLAIALELSEQERAEVATRLLESFDADEQDDVEKAWADEIQRRCAALDSGEEGTSSWEEFRSRIERDVLKR
jgi:putative addiction module component (TIGR02574 family)